MTTDEIIAMAKEAGSMSAAFWPDDFTFLMGVFERFAAIVAAAEREACAKVCESWGGRDYEKCAAAIRERNSHVA